MKPTITHKYLKNILDNLSDENFDDIFEQLQHPELIDQELFSRKNLKIFAKTFKCLLSDDCSMYAFALLGGEMNA